MSEAAGEIAKQLSPDERNILSCLKVGEDLPLEDLARRAGLQSNEAYSAASWLARKSLVEITERTSNVISLGPEGTDYVQNRFPERRVYDSIVKAGGRAELRSLGLPEEVSRVALAWWNKKGLGTIERGPNGPILIAAPTPPLAEDEAFLTALTKPVPEDEAKRLGGRGFDQVKGRPKVLDVRLVKHRNVRLTAEGRAVVSSGGLTADLVGELTPEMIKSGSWKTSEFQTYNLQTASQRPDVAKPHPLVQIIEQIRDIFVELGFSEIEEDFVQSAFWNLDALFIPQDHPAREMQDTFYVSNPATLDVPKDTFERISAVHKSGKGITPRSRGWERGLDYDESQKTLLRTHTTVGTIKYLAKNPTPPIRVFSIGRVFRHETMDATHLPEFHQIEGICTEEGADFPMLLGILQEFYRRLGFPQLRWRPAFFPYTEPSMEVEVWTGTKWMELGGCGIFRPEVTQPFGVKTPVLAWGLGLERLAMMRLGIKDIRDLYVSDLDWLRRQPLV